MMIHKKPEDNSGRIRLPYLIGYPSTLIHGVKRSDDGMKCITQSGREEEEGRPIFSAPCASISVWSVTRVS